MTTHFDNLTDRPLLVIGQTGQLAKSLIEIASKNGLTLYTTRRDQIDLSNMTMDAIDRFITTEMKGEKPAAIINAAAYTAVDNAETEEDLAHKINANGPKTLAEFAHTHGIPFLHVSTDYVYAGNKPTAYVETDPTGPIGAYGRSKLAGEQAVQKANPNSLIFRTSWVYSPYGKNFLKTMLALAEKHPELRVVGDQHGNPSYAPHLAEALLTVCTILVDTETADYAGVYHLCGTGETIWSDFASAIFKASEKYGCKSPTVTAIGTSDYPTPAKRPANSRMSCAKLQEKFGITVPSWQEGVDQCLASLLKEKEKQIAT